MESEESAEEEDDGQSNRGTEWGERSPLLSFSNTDMAFVDDKLVVGSYHGFNVYELQQDGVPKLFSSVVCPGGQGDVSIVGDLLIMSVEQTRGPGLIAGFKVSARTQDPSVSAGFASSTSAILRGRRK